MKTVLFLFLTMLNCFAYAQNEGSLPEVVLGPYKWSTAVNMDEVERDGKLIKADAATSKKDQLFEVTKITDQGEVIFIISAYKVPDSPEAKTYNYAVDGSGVYTLAPATGKKMQRYFKVNKEIVQKYGLHNTVIRQSLNFGLVNFPFKYRLQRSNGNFAGAFNFGAAVGWTAPKRAFRDGNFSILSGYSISNIVLEGSDVRRNSADLEKANNYTAFSFSIGPMFELNTVQVIMSMGFDFLNRNNQKTFGWLDQGKPWLSVGIGYAIFSKQGKEKVKSETNSNNN